MAIEELFEKPQEKKKIVLSCRPTYMGNSDLLYKVYLFAGIPLLLVALIIIYYPIMGLSFSFLLPLIALMINPNYVKYVYISTFLFGSASPVQGISPLGPQIDTMGCLLVTAVIVIMAFKNLTEYLGGLSLLDKLNIFYSIFSTSVVVFRFSLLLLIANAGYRFLLSYLMNPDDVYATVGVPCDIYTIRISSMMGLILSIVVTVTSIFVINQWLQPRLQPIVVSQFLVQKFEKKKTKIPNCLPGKIHIPHDYVFIFVIQNVGKQSVDVILHPENTAKEKVWNIIRRKVRNKTIFYIEPLKKVTDGSISLYVVKEDKKIIVREYEVTADGPSRISVLVSALVTDSKEEVELQVLEESEVKIPITSKIKAIVDDVLSKLDVPYAEIKQVKITVSSFEKSVQINNPETTFAKLIDELEIKTLTEPITLEIKIILKPTIEVNIAYDKNAVVINTYRSIKLIDLLKIAAYYLKDFPPVEEINKIVVNNEEVYLSEDREVRLSNLIEPHEKTVTIVVEKPETA